MDLKKELKASLEKLCIYPMVFLTLQVSSVTFAIAIVGIAGAIRKLKRKMQDRMVPYMAVLAAFVFAAQMFNFPVAGGTSGHLIGAMLVAVLLGPASGIIIISSVLIIQCFVFQDGGIISLGANITNMAVVGLFSGYLVYKLLKKINERLAIFVGAWLSVVMAAFACSLELSLAGIVSAKMVFPVMLGVHALIGIGEGIITVIVVEFVRRSKKWEMV